MPADPVISARVSPTLADQLNQYEQRQEVDQTTAINELLKAGLAARAAEADRRTEAKPTP